MEELTPIKARILEFTDSQGMSITEFCRKVGFGVSNFYGRNKKSEINSILRCNFLSRRSVPVCHFGSQALHRQRNQR